jgi:hypothetical protein
MKLTEQSVHQAVHAYLRAALPPDALEFAVDHAGKATPGIAQRLKSRGGRAGIADHWIIWRGHVYALEVKTEAGRQQDSQKEFADRLLAAGGYYAVVRSVQDVEETLRDWDIPLRAVTMTPQERDARMMARSTPKRPTKPCAQRPQASKLRALARQRAEGIF